MLLFFPFRVSHSWPAKVLVLPIVAFAILYNIPKFFELPAQQKGLTTAWLAYPIIIKDKSKLNRQKLQIFCVADVYAQCIYV